MAGGKPKTDDRKPEIGIKDLWPMLLYSLRYVLGRQGAAPSWWRDTFLRYARFLTQDQMIQILEEIRVERAKETKTPGHLGGVQALGVWKELETWLEVRLKLAQEPKGTPNRWGNR